MCLPGRAFPLESTNGRSHCRDRRGGRGLHGGDFRGRGIRGRSTEQRRGERRRPEGPAPRPPPRANPRRRPENPHERRRALQRSPLGARSRPLRHHFFPEHVEEAPPRLAASRATALLRGGSRHPACPRGGDREAHPSLQQGEGCTRWSARDRRAERRRDALRRIRERPGAGGGRERRSGG